MLVNSVPHCGGSVTGKICSTSADCASEAFFCTYDAPFDLTCSNACTRFGSSFSFSQSASSTFPSLSSSASIQSSSESPAFSSTTSSLFSFASFSTSSLVSQSSASNPLFSSSTGFRGCVNDAECSTGQCVNGSCFPCSATNECLFGECLNHACQVPTLVSAARICGNGILEAPEECDDGNTRDGDGCTSTCLLEVGICGDGIVERLLGEQCEQSLHDPSLPYQCVHCRFVSSTCGDGKVDPGEECDSGEQNSTAADAACRPDCSRPRCGDGILDSSEQCDDGNRRNGDGCDRFCRTEAGTQPQIAGLFDRQTINFPGILNSQTIAFPTQPTTQSLPIQLPLASLEPLIQSTGPKGNTGPAAVMVVASGAASGLAWVRRRRK